MTARTKVTRALKLCAFTLCGMWVGAHAGTLLDIIFTGEATIAFVCGVFGGWSGSMIGGSGWADTVSSFRHRTMSKATASIAVPLAAMAGMIAVVKIADSATFISGFLVGIAMMFYLLARDTRYRFLFASVVFGAFVGAAISAAGGIAAVERVTQVLQFRGFDALIESGQSEGLRHRYLGRDREDLFIGTVFLGYAFVGALMMIAFFVLGILGVSIDVFKRNTNVKRKRKLRASNR